MRKKTISLALVLALVISMFTFVMPTASADVEWWDVSNYPEMTYPTSGITLASNFAGMRTFNVTIGGAAGRTVEMTHYWGWYSENPNWAAQRINIYIPETADENTPVFFITTNSGWSSNTFPNTMGQGTNFAVGSDSRNALAMERGHILVTYGSRDRANAAPGVNNAYDRKSPNTVSDAKAAIRFVKANINADNIPGSADLFYTTGNSGGGGLTTAIAASGNHPDFYPTLYEIGAYGIEWIGSMDFASATVKEKTNPVNWINRGDDSVFATLSWYPMSYMGGGDYAYEYDYYATRQGMVDGLFPGHLRTSGAYMGNTSGPGTAATGWYDWQLAYSRVLSNQFAAYATAYSGINCVSEVDAALVDLAVTSLNRHIVNPFGTRDLVTQLRAGNGTSATNWAGLPMDWYTMVDGVVVDVDRDGLVEYSAHRAQYFKQIGMQANMGVNGGDNGVEGMFGNRNEHTAPVHALAYAVATPRWGTPDNPGWTDGLVDWDSYDPAWNNFLRTGGPTGNNRPGANTDGGRFMAWKNIQSLAILAAIEAGELDPTVAFNAYEDKDLVEWQARTSSTKAYILNDRDIALSDTAPFWFIRTGLHDDGTALSTYAIMELGLRYSPKVVSHDHQLIVGMGHNHMGGDQREAFVWLDSVLDFTLEDANTTPRAFASIVETSKNSRVWELTFNVTETYANGIVEVVTYTIALNGNNANLDGRYVFPADHALAGYTLFYDIKGNGSNIKTFELR